MVADSRSALATIAAVIFAATGLLYAVGSIPVTSHILRERELPVMFGIPFYGGSFFARQGIDWVIASSFAFILVGLAHIAVGYLVWNSLKIGAIVAILGFPVIMGISIGGEAPVPLLLEPLKLLIILIAWSSLH